MKSIYPVSRPDADRILRAIVKNDYDSVVLIDSTDGSVVDIYNGSKILDDTDIEDLSNIKYDDGIRNYLLELCADLNLYDVFDRMSLHHVIEELKLSPSYQIYYLRYNTEGSRMRKKVSFYNTDANKRWICCTVRDVTENFIKIEKQKQKIEEALQIAKSADKSKSEFLTHVSREIRTPLSSVMGSIQLARKEIEKTDIVEECLDDMQTSIRYINDLIDDILDIRRIDENRLELKEDVIEIRELLHGIERIALPRMEEKRIRFSYETQNMSHPRLIGDRKRLNQIMIKLLDNAIRNTAAGGEIKILVKEEIKRKNIATLEINIRDTGRGMTREKIAELFTPFVYDERNIEDHRSGIGLSLVKSFVDAMGGTIIAESKEGLGSNFVVTIELPIVSESAKKAQDTVTQKSYDFTGATVLIVEDHPLNMSIARKLLENVGITVITAVNGQEAVERFNMNYDSINAILMDIRMPVMDGLEATRLIRSSARKNSREVPIIAMTADAFEEDIHRSFESGMNDHLAKPINPSLLYETIGRLIKRT